MHREKKNGTARENPVQMYKLHAQIVVYRDKPPRRPVTNPLVGTLCTLQLFIQVLEVFDSSNSGMNNSSEISATWV
jgi:hypothetical protein